MELHHVIYRGVDGRAIFMDNQDRARFVHDLYEFNDTKPADVYHRRSRFSTVASHSTVGHDMSDMREKVVDLHGWKLMPNHVHLLLSEKVDKGLSLFVKKMRGYGRYFNECHERHGRLFDTTKKIPIVNEAHFLYILHYVHLNGLDNLSGAEGWRARDRGTIRNVNAAIEHLKADKWSSFRDYCGIRNFPSILTKDLFEEKDGEYLKSLRSYLADRERGSLDEYELE